MNMLDTIEDSYFEMILPEGWDLHETQTCVSNSPESAFQGKPFGIRILHLSNVIISRISVYTWGMR